MKPRGFEPAVSRRSLLTSAFDLKQISLGSARPDAIRIRWQVRQPDAQADGTECQCLPGFAFSLDALPSHEDMSMQGRHDRL